MNDFTRMISRKLLGKALSHACPSSISRSGKEGEKVNCFNVAIDKGNAPYLIILSINGDVLDCLEFDGSRYKIPRNISLNELSPSEFVISHYYGLAEVRYSGLFDYAINTFSYWPYIRIAISRYIYSFDQFFFNKRKLVTKQRTDLLKFMMQQALEGKRDFNSIDLMTDLYSIKWVSHPNADSQQHRLDFYLESLENTGELKKANSKYHLTGFALKAIEEYEEQERKHGENVKIQRRTFWLTLAITALTVVQAGLIKLPALFDFTHK